MNKDNIKTWSVTIAAAAVATTIREISLAEESPFADELCGLSNWFTGDTGGAIATVAIIFLGIAAFFGKVTWGLALMFAVGIFAIFGSAEIVSSISDGQGCVSEA
mgnify:CR=1 FL=1